MMRRVLYLTFGMLLMCAGLDADAKRKNRRPMPHPDSLIEKLPTLEGGDEHGYFAFYRTPKFDAVIEDDCKLYIRVKEGGKYIGPDILFGWPFAHYHHDRKKRTVGRHIEKFVSPKELPLEPIKQPKKVVIRGYLQDRVEFVVEYKFRGTTVEASGGYIDPEDIDYPSTFFMRTHIKASHDIKPAVEQPERARLLKGNMLRTKEYFEGRLKRFTYPYHEVASFRGPLGQAEAKGPWGKNTIVIKEKKTDRRFVPWIYPEFCPWQGYYFQYYAKDNEIKRYKAMHSITVR